MISLNSIDQEIRETIDELIQNSKNGIPRDWAVNAVMRAHLLPECEEYEWYDSTARHLISTRAHRIFNEQKKISDQGGDPQLVLEGFKHLQRQYSVERNGEVQHVKLEHMTPLEGRKRAAEYRVMSKTLKEHADELDKWIDDTYGKDAGYQQTAV